MTKSPQSDPQSWSEANLPVLTEIADDSGPSTGGMDIPDFDFSAEMDSISAKLDARAEPDLEFPPELLLDGLSVEPSTQEPGLDFNRLPSLDLSDGDADPKVDTGFEFEFEPEPEGLDALMARATLEPVANPAPVSLADRLSSALKIEASHNARPVAEVIIPELVDEVEERAPEPVAEVTIPELVDEVEERAPEPVAEVIIPELADEVEERAPEPVAEVIIPELVDEVEERAPEPVAEVIIPELVDEVEERAPEPVAEVIIPELAEVVEEFAPELVAEVPLPALDDVAEEFAPEPVAEVPLPVLDKVAEERAPEPVAEVVAPEPPAELSIAPYASDALFEPAPGGGDDLANAIPFQTISLDSLPRGVLGGGSGLVAPPAPVLAPNMEDLIRAAEVTLAEELRAQAQLRAEQEAAMAAAALQAIAAAPAQVASAPLEPVVVASSAVPEAAVPEAPVTPPLIVSQEPLEVAAPALPMTEHRPVEIINVAGLVSSGPVPTTLPPLRKSYVTLVDESMLIDSLYHKILPRMKVELSLWLQDALDSQAKIMLSGVMHQLKEDYEMLFSETLRDSLRQAIAEMGREDRGDRF